MDSLFKIKKDSVDAISLVPGGIAFRQESAIGTAEPITSSRSADLPMYITVPVLLPENRTLSGFNDQPGRGSSSTFMLLINPETLNCGKTASIQSNYTRRGFITQMWGLNQDTLTSTGKTAAFFISSEGLTNYYRKYSVGMLNFMALINAYKNNGYRLIDRTTLSTLQDSIRVIDVIHGIQIIYDGNIFMGHFNNFTLDEDAENPYLLNYNFEFTVSAYGSVMNEICGHYTKPEDDLKNRVLKVKKLEDLGIFVEDPESAFINPDGPVSSNVTTETVKDLWEYRTGYPWSIAVEKGLDKDPGLYYSLNDNAAYADLVKNLSPVSPSSFSRETSTLKRIDKNYRAMIQDSLNNIGSTVSYAGKDRPISYKPTPDQVIALIAQESAGDPSAISPYTRYGYSYGLMQINENTGPDLGVNNVATATESQNIQAGVNYMSYLLTRYDGNFQLALAAYNAGPGRVDQAGGVPLIKETQRYVTEITAMTQWVEQNPADQGKTPDQVAQEASKSPKTESYVNTAWAQPETVQEYKGPVRFMDMTYLVRR